MPARTDPETQAPRPVTPVGILAELLRDAVANWDELSDEDRRARVTRAADLAGGLDPYLDECTTAQSPALAELARRTGSHDWTHVGDDVGVLVEQEMLSGHVEGAALRMLVRMAGARRVLDIGMFTGYSALAMAEALPPDGVVVACEINADVAAFAADSFRASPAGRRITIEVGPAHATLRALAAAGERFDFVFVDADKAGYLDYVHTLLDDGLLAPGGTICIDNTLMQGEPWLSGTPSANGTAITDFNAALAGDPRVEQVLLPLRDGMTLARRVHTDQEAL
ncbi:O-methyltransferase [uncultured Jatrophihabitans sp.]|uniref:O-methyltransferase n=1 Tax=uncultured Jatrophihabitans sp. TaxID=1610747 RepID=UPI0035CBC2BF